MALTREFKRTVVERVQRDPAFAKALLDEAATLFLNGEADTARLVLRDLVNATVDSRTGGRDRQAGQEPASHAFQGWQPDHGQSRCDRRCHPKEARRGASGADRQSGVTAVEPGGKVRQG